MSTNDLLRNALYAAGAAADEMHGKDIGDHYRAFADESYSPEPSLYCDLDGFGLIDGECPRCEREAAAEQAFDDREDMEWED